MWFAILTPGAHECRPHPHPDELTIYSWTDVARKRIDGPVFSVHIGLRRLREWALEAGEETFAPRCFVCRAEYVLPDPEAARAGARDLRDAAPADDVDPVEALAAAAPAGPGPFAGDAEATLFACVHIADRPPDGEADEEEALVVVPARRLALAVPLDALPLVLELLRETADDSDLLACPDCGALAPGSDASPQAARPSRAERRAAARAGRRGGRRCARR